MKLAGERFRRSAFSCYSLSQSLIVNITASRKATGLRRDADFFETPELTLLYMARRLPDALRLEKLLTNSGIDYLVETGTYIGGLLMCRELTGAFFYIAPESIGAARALLLQNRYKPYEPG
jgi:hypothetical protein